MQALLIYKVMTGCLLGAVPKHERHMPCLPTSYAGRHPGTMLTGPCL